MTVDIVVPVFNQLHYTRKCLETLRETVGEDVRIIVIDNGSTDGTAEYLAATEGITVISNPANRGCAAAWNQGVRAGSAPHVVILNNDVLLPQGWLDGLLGFAREKRIDIACPAVREGEFNYDLAPYAREFMDRMAKVMRPGEAHGICFLVRREVFDTIGLFDELFTIGGGEDTDFFWRARRAGYRLATTGSSFFHHFGCVTQDYIKEFVLGRCYGPEHRAHFRRKWHLSWGRRFVIRHQAKAVALYRRTTEKMLYGHTLREKWIGGKLRYY